MSGAPETAAQPMETEATPVAENLAEQVLDTKAEDVTAINANKENQETKPLKPAKVVFRLDDGTVARFKDDSKSVELLNPQAAWKAGSLTEEHLLRIQSFLCEVHAKLPEEGPLKSVSLGSKRSIDTVLEVGQINSAKKTKSTFGNHGSTPITSPGDVSSRRNKDFASVARTIVRYLTTSVLKKTNNHLFMEPVDATQEQLKDYYEVVPHGPISYNIILKKIDDNQYTSPKEFYDDIFKIFDNCYQYNIVVHPQGWEVGVLGIKMERAFLKAWSKTAFASFCDPDRKPREMPKGNPLAPTKAASKPARSSSVGRPQPKSHAPKILMTTEMENDLVTALNTPAILEANMEAVVEILTIANEMGTDEDGEPSLDLEKVSAPTKRKLYDLVVKKPSSAGAAKPATSGFKMEDDDDFEPDDDDI